MDESSIIELEEQAEEEAEKLRAIHKLGIRGIKDPFQFVEQSLGYLLIRYPLGEDSIQGFATIHTGEELIVTNSSERLSREIFTLAHEIGHIIFDFKDRKPKIIRDVKIGDFEKENYIEYRADCFAANFLMPKEGIVKKLKEMKIRNQRIDYFDVIQLQIEFSVSYRSMVRRLHSLNFIDYSRATELYNYYEELGLSLSKLFKRINADTRLLDRTYEIHVPLKYFKYLQSNYENGYISYDVLTKVLESINETPERLGFNKISHIQSQEDDDIDIDSLIKEFDN